MKVKWKEIRKKKTALQKKIAKGNRIISAVCVVFYFLFVLWTETDILDKWFKSGKFRKEKQQENITSRNDKEAGTIKTGTINGQK